MNEVETSHSHVIEKVGTPIPWLNQPQEVTREKSFGKWPNPKILPLNLHNKFVNEKPKTYILVKKILASICFEKRFLVFSFYFLKADDLFFFFLFFENIFDSIFFQNKIYKMYRVFII